VSRHLLSSPKGKHKIKKKTKKNILGQHERDLNVTMPCGIPKRRTQETKYNNIEKNEGINRRMQKEREEIKKHYRG
jgi:flagellar biosynthesis/type III secretory pathway M-ring protein FliF/YscJ